MDKLTAWIRKRNFKVDIKPVEYGANYFYNAPALHFDGIEIFISWENGYAPAARIDKEIKKYMDRYGYTVIRDGHILAGLYIFALRDADAAALRLYWNYQDKSVKQWEIVQHSYYQGTFQLKKSLNDTTYDIMNKWGLRYLSALRKQEKNRCTI